MACSSQRPEETSGWRPAPPPSEAGKGPRGARATDGVGWPVPLLTLGLSRGSFCLVTCSKLGSKKSLEKQEARVWTSGGHGTIFQLFGREKEGPARLPQGAGCRGLGHRQPRPPRGWKFHSAKSFLTVMGNEPPHNFHCGPTGLLETRQNEPASLSIEADPAKHKHVLHSCDGQSVCPLGRAWFPELGHAAIWE